jgi:Rieske 2Fe-2S family protein
LRRRSIDAATWFWDGAQPVTTLHRCEPTLPATYYYDPAHYRRELEAIWYRSWLCAGRVEEIADAGSYCVYRIGDQAVIVTRDADGRLHAFHNTCRHRGAELCAEPRGRFPRERIVCPYHSWTYGLNGDLLATPHRLPSAGFEPARYGLYRLALATWAGFVFVNLERQPPQSLEQSLGISVDTFAHWPLERLTIVHRETHTVACNWKVFWENFSECYHCPRVHPELCQLVPMYGRAVVSAEDDPRGNEEAGSARSPLAPGATTWTLDGTTRLPSFPELTEAERRAGMTFVTMLPGMFIVAHLDYVRTVRMRPLGPEQTELTVDWLLQPEASSNPGFDLERLVALGRLVVAQDGRVCEINQRGLHCRAHDTGILVAQEHGVYELHRWLRERLVAQP